MDLATLATAFGLIFIAELGDKSQLALFALSARSGRFVSTFVGGVGALVLATLIAALLGSLLGAIIPDTAVRIGGAAIFIGLGLWLAYEIRSNDEDGNWDDDDEDDSLAYSSWIRVLVTSFVALFVAELGDKSQLAVAALASERGKFLEPFAGSALALVVLGILAVTVGNALSRWLPARRVHIVASIAFIVAGVLLLVLG